MRARRAKNHLRHVTIDDLDKCQLTVVRHDVEGLRLDASRIHGLPFQVVSGELGIRRRLGLLGDRPNGRWPIDGLLGAGDVGHPT